MSQDFWNSYRPTPLDVATISTVIVYQGKNLGDALLSTPIINVLQRHGVSKIYFVVKEECAQIYENMSGVECVIRKRRLVHVISSALKIRKLKPDLFIDLHGSFDSAVTSRLVGSRISIQMAGLKHRLVGRYHAVVPSKTNFLRHRIDMHLDVMRRLGYLVQSSDRKIVVEGLLGTPRNSTKKKIKNLMPYIVVHPGARWLFKSPNPEFWVGLISEVTGSTGLSVILTGKHEDREGQLLDYLTHNTCAKLWPDDSDLSDLAQLLRHAHAYIGVDTFTSHLANAMELPGIVLFGPSDERCWGPHPEQASLKTVVSQRFSCRPCNLDGCGGGKKSECLTSLDPVQTAEQFLEISSQHYLK